MNSTVGAVAFEISRTGKNVIKGPLEDSFLGEPPSP
jgi:hypothetical protein